MFRVYASNVALVLVQMPLLSFAAEEEEEKKTEIKRDKCGRQRSDRFPRLPTGIHTVKREVCRLRNTSAQLRDVKGTDDLFILCVLLRALGRRYEI